MAITIEVLGPQDESVLGHVASGVFDHSTEPHLIREFLNDPRHHIAVALDGALVVGFVSGVHYVHPDKPAELWINEVGVAPSHRNRGIAKRLLSAVLNVGVQLGCRVAWVLTDRGNDAAMGLYTSAGGLETGAEQVMFSFSLNGSSPEGAA